MVQGLLLLLILSGGCKMRDQQTPNDMTSTSTQKQAITVTSASFKQGETIPKRYSCEGENISPAITWSAGPSGTKSYALVCEDPDAPSGMFIHWVMYNIPASEHGLAENIEKKDVLPNGTREGKNGAGNTGYTGPCPPPGKPHRYFFRVFALDTELNLSGDVTRDLLMAAIQSHILAEGSIMGTYQR
jgi:Raf kinase inhibitor-like YbhB/YbcL family protein